MTYPLNACALAVGQRDIAREATPVHLSRGGTRPVQPSLANAGIELAQQRSTKSQARLNRCRSIDLHHSVETSDLVTDELIYELKGERTNATSRVWWR